MHEENEPPIAAVKPEDNQEAQTSIVKTLFSLALYIAIDYWIFQSWLAVLILVSVIVIHESGHFIAMKFFGYQSVNMTFIPLLGAYVSGKASNFSRKNKLIVLLAGPLPGIIIGSVFFYLYHQQHDYIYFKIAMPFLLLNVFNLLPVFPLDGGQFFQTLFLNGSRIVQLAFLYISLGVMLYLFFKLHYAWWTLIIAVMIFIRIGAVNFINKVRKKLDEEGVDYACSYDDLTDEEYYHIRKAVIGASKSLSKKYATEEQSGDEQDLIRHVENVLVPVFEDDLTTKDEIIFTQVWLLSLLLPVLGWWYLQGLG